VEQNYDVNHRLAFLLIPTHCAVAQIDSGGGTAQAGNLTNQSSIGSPFATGISAVGTLTNRSGLVQVLYSTGNSSNPDVDGNGIADAWEQLYFPNGAPSPETDSDGDGATNRFEYIAGTNPTQKTSVFGPQGTWSSGTYTLPIASVTGRLYKVYATRDLKTWVLQQSFDGDGTEKQFTFDETTVPSGPLHSPSHPSTYYFRVEVVLK
jgi:hypothetical protein